MIGISVKTTRSEYGELEAAAKQDGKALGEWAREVLLREARHAKEAWLAEAMVTELVAVRMLMVGLMKPLLLGQKASLETISEIMAVVRREKRNTGREVLEQYRPARIGEQ